MMDVSPPSSAGSREISMAPTLSLTLISSADWTRNARVLANAKKYVRALNDDGNGDLSSGGFGSRHNKSDRRGRKNRSPPGPPRPAAALFACSERYGGNTLNCKN